MQCLLQRDSPRPLLLMLLLYRYGAPPNKKVVFFIDDVNMPAREKYGAQPPIELLRQLQDFRGMYDRKQLFWRDIEDVTLCAACGPPGGGRQEVSARCVVDLLTQSARNVHPHVLRSLAAVRQLTEC